MMSLSSDTMKNEPNEICNIVVGEEGVQRRAEVAEIVDGADAAEAVAEDPVEHLEAVEPDESLVAAETVEAANAIEPTDATEAMGPEDTPDMATDAPITGGLQDAAILHDAASGSERTDDLRDLRDLAELDHDLFSSPAFSSKPPRSRENQNTSSTAAAFASGYGNETISEDRKSLPELPSQFIDSLPPHDEHTQEQQNTINNSAIPQGVAIQSDANAALQSSSNQPSGATDQNIISDALLGIPFHTDDDFDFHASDDSSHDDDETALGDDDLADDTDMLLKSSGPGRFSSFEPNKARFLKIRKSIMDSVVLQQQRRIVELESSVRKASKKLRKLRTTLSTNGETKPVVPMLDYNRKSSPALRSNNDLNIMDKSFPVRGNADMLATSANGPRNHSIVRVAPNTAIGKNQLRPSSANHMAAAHTKTLQTTSIRFPEPRTSTAKTMSHGIATTAANTSQIMTASSFLGPSNVGLGLKKGLVASGAASTLTAPAKPKGSYLPSEVTSRIGSVLVGGTITSTPIAPGIAKAAPVKLGAKMASNPIAPAAQKLEPLNVVPSKLVSLATQAGPSTSHAIAPAKAVIDANGHRLDSAGGSTDKSRSTNGGPSSTEADTRGAIGASTKAVPSTGQTPAIAPRASTLNGNPNPAVKAGEMSGGATVVVKRPDLQIVAQPSTGDDIPQDMGQTRYWTQAEHDRFLQAVKTYGSRSYAAISQFVGTRTPKQVRTHSQKYSKRLQREEARRREAAAALSARAAAGNMGLMGKSMIPPKAGISTKPNITVPLSNTVAASLNAPASGPVKIETPTGHGKSCATSVPERTSAHGVSATKPETTPSGPINTAPKLPQETKPFTSTPGANIAPPLPNADAKSERKDTFVDPRAAPVEKHPAAPPKQAAAQAGASEVKDRNADDMDESNDDDDDDGNESDSMSGSSDSSSGSETDSPNESEDVRELAESKVPQPNAGHSTMPLVSEPEFISKASTMANGGSPLSVSPVLEPASTIKSMEEPANPQEPQPVEAKVGDKARPRDDDLSAEQNPSKRSKTEPEHDKTESQVASLEEVTIESNPADAVTRNDSENRKPSEAGSADAAVLIQTPPAPSSSDGSESDSDDSSSDQDSEPDTQVGADAADKQVE